MVNYMNVAALPSGLISEILIPDYSAETHHTPTFCQNLNSCVRRQMEIREQTFPNVSYLKNQNPIFSPSHPLHQHLHFMTGKGLIREVETRSRLSPEFSWSVYVKERTPVPNLFCSECTSLLIHTPHHPLSLLSHHRHPPPSSPFRDSPRLHRL